MEMKRSLEEPGRGEPQEPHEQEEDGGSSVLQDRACKAAARAGQQGELVLHGRIGSSEEHWN